MSIPFSRSMRSLNTDSFRPSLVGLFFAIVLLTAWAAWFFLARVTLYEISQTARVTKEGMVVADFPPEALGRIRPGQPALLRFGGDVGDQAGTIPAIVANVTNQAREGRVRVELFALVDAAFPGPLQEGLTGQVEIEVEHVSPATLVVRASGQFLDTPPISLSPQNSRGLGRD